MILTPSSSKSTVHKNHCFSDSLLYIPARWFSSPPYGQSVSRPFSTRTMSSCSSESPPPTLRTVTISYSHLKDKNVDLSAKIEEGFGPNGLGILSISDVPEYSSLRQNLLRLAPRLACLPEDVKKELEDPNSRYNFGWSHGKEKLESGKPDILKGSFYANPIFDTPTTDESLVQRYPSYCGSNIWPDRALPELEVAFKALGKLILDVGLMVAYHCDRYVSRGMTMHEDEGLEQILLRSRCHKVFLPKMVRLCHLGVAGILIMVPSQVVFGEDEIAYQIGETSEILSRGHLCATPHCVRVLLVFH
ncbi:uncharacterized protein LOC114276510 isoform X8 [Camellia sinensis]|uniref:uncharacterized protein LOC114276510 isoform X8 n=1 Tax=Camellia sinensis TaxID=4442 RepID=UPI001035F552|nr:uncharacterized protein LOC114276510 isoform X8 [Camellia sinensis]